MSLSQKVLEIFTSDVVCIVRKCYFYAKTKFHGCSFDRCLAAPPQSHRKVAMLMSTKVAYGGERAKNLTRMLPERSLRQKREVDL